MSIEEYWIGRGVDYDGVWRAFREGLVYIDKCRTIRVHVLRIEFEQYPGTLPLFSLGRRFVSKGMAAENAESKSPIASKQDLMSSLRWALFFLGFGAAAILYDSLQQVPFVTGGFGLMFLGAGLGYLIYLLVAWRWFNKEEHRYE